MSAPAPMVGSNLGLWNSQAVTFKRNVRDQQINPNAMAGTAQSVQTQKLSTSGYLRWLEITIPPVSGTLTVGTGSFTYTANNFPAAHIIRSLQLSVGNVNNVINVNGIGLGVLNYVNAGDCRGWARSSGKQTAAMGAYNSAGSVGYPFQYPASGAANSAGPGAIDKWGGTWFQNTSTTAVNLSYRQIVPITEWIKFPNTIMGQFGNAPILGEMPYEVGLLPLQNTAQNVQPVIQLNALYGADNTTPILITGNAVGTITPQINIDTAYYDVPPLNSPPQAYPTPYQTMFLVTRIQNSVPVTGGAVTYQFANAGFLMRASYIFYNEGTTVGTLLDVTTLPAAIKTIKSANVVQRSVETIQQNAARCWDLYGTPPPGIAVDDFLTETGTNVDFLDTSLFTQLQVIFSGLTNVTRMEVLEERLIPVGMG